jgi:alanine racemase
VSFGARAVIRLGALKHNLQVIRERSPGSKVMAVVKANAYGHGMVEVARALADADCLAVARLSEAQSLRAAGIGSPIVILEGAFDADELAVAVSADFEIVVHCPEQLELLGRLDAGRLAVWLKFETGMNRLGLPASNATELIERARRCKATAKLRLMSHLASADNRRDETTAEQFRLFESIADGFDGDISIASSPALFAWQQMAGDVAGLNPGRQVWVRPGIALYGISPFDDTTGADLGLRPVMQLRSRLISVKKIRAGGRVGYGGIWEAKEDSIIGIAAAGYADGYSRFLPTGTPVLVNDRRVPLAGRVSMDMIAVDLGPDAGDKFGDPVLLWGDDLPVEEIARYAGTIPYQLVCGVGRREPSEFVD